MKILYVITTPDHGGAQVNLLDLLSGWPEGVDSIVATGEEGFLTDAARELGVEIVIVSHLTRPLSPIRDFQAYREIMALIRDRRPDLVHCHSSKAGLLGRLAANAVGVPAVFTVHGWAFEDGISWLHRTVGRAAEHVAAKIVSNQHVITVAEADRNLAIELDVIEPERMTTIHNGIEDDLRIADPAFPGTATMVMVARFSDQKDHETLFKALAGVAEPFQMILVGDGPSFESTRQLAKDVGVASQVEFLGNRVDVPDILAGAQVFVLSSLWEGFPISILEAMRAGLPVVATDVGGVSEAVIDGETGIVTSPRDAEVLGNAIQRLLSDPLLRDSMGKKGRQRYVEHFGKKQMLAKTAVVYSNLVGGPVAGPLASLVP
ncbi:MAG: glycosyltransferase family 4 protein [Rhodothermia bacterium]